MTTSPATVYASQYPTNDNYHTYLLMSVLKGRHTKFALTEKSVDTARAQFKRLVQGEELHHVKIKAGTLLEKIYNHSTSASIPKALAYVLYGLLPKTLVQYVAKKLLVTFNEEEYCKESCVIILDNDPIGILSALAVKTPTLAPILYSNTLLRPFGPFLSIREFLGLLLEKHRHINKLYMYIAKYIKLKKVARTQTFSFYHITSPEDYKVCEPHLDENTVVTAYGVTLDRLKQCVKLKAADMLHAKSIVCVNSAKISHELQETLDYIHSASNYKIIV
jgi:hypothetical protein